MECLPQDEVLEFNPNTLAAVRKVHGFNNTEDMKQAVDELDEWVKKQKHFLKRDFSRYYLETMIISNKGLMDRTKERLDKACTLRTTMPQYFGDFDIRNDFKEFDGLIKQAILPKLTKENNRVLLTKSICKSFKPTVILQSIRYTCMSFEYMKVHDYCDGIILVVDIREASLLQLLRRARLNDFREAATIVINGYGMRLKGMHLLTSSTLINILLWFFKQVITEKLANRVHVHQTPKTLQNFIPREILPIEYDGTERSLVDLHDEWINILGSDLFRRHLKVMSQARTDESRRQTSGSERVSIRNLNID